MIQFPQNPVLDTNGPYYTPNLFGVWVPDAATGGMKNLRVENGFDADQVVGTPSIVSGDNGPGLACYNTGGGHVRTSQSRLWASGRTGTMLAAYWKDPDIFDAPFNLNAIASISFFYPKLIVQNAGLRALWRTNGGSILNIGGGDGVGFHTAAVVGDGDTIRLYADGEAKSTTTASAGDSLRIDNTFLSVGTEGSYTDRRIDGLIYLGAMWDVQLSESDALALTADPTLLLASATGNTTAKYTALKMDKSL